MKKKWSFQCFLIDIKFDHINYNMKKNSNDILK